MEMFEYLVIQDLLKVYKAIVNCKDLKLIAPWAKEIYLKYLSSDPILSDSVAQYLSNLVVIAYPNIPKLKPLTSRDIKKIIKELEKRQQELEQTKKVRGITEHA